MGNSHERNVDHSQIHQLREKEIQILMAATKLNRDEIEAWHGSFLIQYPRGYINKAEFIKIYKELYKDGHPEKFAQFAFNAFDLDHNGKLTFQEFIMSTAFLVKPDSKAEERLERLSLAFDIFDINHNGQISRKELLKIYTAIYELKHKYGHDEHAKEHVNQVLAKYDWNNDGYLSKEEFVDAMHSENIFSFFD